MIVNNYDKLVTVDLSKATSTRSSLTVNDILSNCERYHTKLAGIWKHRTTIHLWGMSKRWLRYKSHRHSRARRPYSYHRAGVDGFLFCLDKESQEKEGSQATSRSGAENGGGSLKKKQVQSEMDTADEAVQRSPP